MPFDLKVLLIILIKFIKSFILLLNVLKILVLIISGIFCVRSPEREGGEES